MSTNNLPFKPSFTLQQVTNLVRHLDEITNDYDLGGVSMLGDQISVTASTRNREETRTANLTFDLYEMIGDEAPVPDYTERFEKDWDLQEKEMTVRAYEKEARDKAALKAKRAKAASTKVAREKALLKKLLSKYP